MSSKVVVTNSETGQLFDVDLTQDETKIGRAAHRNEIVLDDGQVSREHALIRRIGRSYMIVDLGSANGTFFAGQRVKERILNNDDVFAISKFTFTFKDQSQSLAVKFDSEKIGNTVLLRKPEQVLAALPQLDKASISVADLSSKTLLDDIERLRKKADTLSRLYELNEVLSSVFGLEEIFKKVAEMIFRLTPADRFLVLLKDRLTGELTPMTAEFRRRSGTQTGQEISVSKTVLDRVLGERVSLLSFDAQGDARLASAKSIIMQNIHSVMCAPLLSKSEILGVIYVDCQQVMQVFGEDDLDFLNAVAGGTSIAVDNAMTHKQLVKEELARAAYGRFMPKHVVDEILANPGTLSLGGSNKEVTMLFSDVRGFTNMSETLPPETVVQILNEYFSDMSPIVFEHHGLLDKYMGDGLMALFGVPYPSEDSASDAVSAAIDMQRRMEAVNRELKAIGLDEIAIGIGVNTGMVTVGYIGSEERTDYTAIGDAVNLAARLEKQAEGGQIVISHATMKAIGDRFPVQPCGCGEVRVKGKREPVQIYEVIWQEIEQTEPPLVSSSHLARPTKS
jgi:adenylate cyclase